MGRKSKGDRHTIIPSMPLEAGMQVKAEAAKLGCYVGDYIAYVVCERVGVYMQVPTGEVTDHPDPLPGPGDLVRYRTMVPRRAADRVIDESDRRGISLSDVVTEALCEHFEIPFTPTVKKKALKAWAKAAEAGEQLSMTG